VCYCAFPLFFEAGHAGLGLQNWPMRGGGLAITSRARGYSSYLTQAPTLALLFPWTSTNFPSPLSSPAGFSDGPIASGHPFRQEKERRKKREKGKRRGSGKKGRGKRKKCGRRGERKGGMREFIPAFDCARSPHNMPVVNNHQPFVSWKNFSASRIVSRQSHSVGR